MQIENNQRVVCIGELLIDFFCTDVDVRLIEGEHFLKQAGGAPANVSAAICKLGGQSAFVGKVGQDPFGAYLKKTLDDEGVDTSMLIQDEQSPTTLAFVSLQADGERDFVFNRGADGLLTYEELDLTELRKAKIMHFGSATALLEDPFHAAYMRAMRDAKEQHILVSFDPNYRENLWAGNSFVGDVPAFIARSRKAIGLCDVVKVSEEELYMIAGTQDRIEGIQNLHKLGAQVVMVTLGKEGTCLSNGQRLEIVPSVAVKSIDSTGAGDSFVGAVLCQLAALQDSNAVLSDFDHLQDMIAFANKVGALVCTRVGAISALPTYEEIEIKRVP